KPYAEDAARTVARLLDNYAKQWVSQKTDLCLDRQVRQKRDPLLGLRAECLAQRRDELGALVQILKHDSAVVTQSVRAAYELTPIGACNNPAMLKIQTISVADASKPNEARKIAKDVATVKELINAAKYSDALAKAQAAVANARKLKYSPLEAEALYWLGL